MKMRVQGRSWKMGTYRGISRRYDLINLTRKKLINRSMERNEENLSDEKTQETPCAGSDLTFFKSEIKKSEGLENIPVPSPVPAA